MEKTSRTPPSIESTVTELTLAVGQMLRRLRTETNPDGLTWSQIAALARLEGNGPLTTAELARAEAVKPQSMGAILSELENEGLVARSPHPTDGRQVLFALTQSGIEARSKRHTAKQTWLVKAVANLNGEEQRILASAVELMKRMADS